MKTKLFILLAAAAGMTSNLYAGTEICAPTFPPPELGFASDHNNFYAEVNGGAVFFNAPGHNATTIFQGIGTPPGKITSEPITSFSTTDKTGSVGGTFGYVIDRHPADCWMGSNLRVEVGGEYYQTSANSTTAINTSAIGGPAYAAMGRLDGQNGTHPTAVLATTATGTHVAAFAFNNNDDVYDVDAVVKSDYSLAHGAYTVTPKLGLAYAHIDQHFNTKGTGVTTAPTSASELESIGTDYFGAVLGLELKANVCKQFIMFMDTTTTLSGASSSYSGSQSYTSPGPGGSGTDSVHSSYFGFNVREQAGGGFYYLFGPVTLKVEGGVDCWSDVAEVQEAAPRVGSSLLAGANVAPSHLGTATMVNPEANVTVIVPF